MLTIIEQMPIGQDRYVTTASVIHTLKVYYDKNLFSSTTSRRKYLFRETFWDRKILIKYIKTLCLENWSYLLDRMVILNNECLGFENDNNRANGCP